MWRLRARRVRIGCRWRRDAALKHGRHGVVLVQKLLERTDVLDRRAQRLHFAHFLVRGSVGHVLAKRLEAHVDLLDSVPLAFVASGNSHGLLLRDWIAESVECQSPLAPQKLWAAGALSLQHFGVCVWRAALPVLFLVRRKVLRKLMIKWLLSCDDSCLHFCKTYKINKQTRKWAGAEAVGSLRGKRRSRAFRVAGKKPIVGGLAECRYHLFGDWSGVEGTCSPFSTRAPHLHPIRTARSQRKTPPPARIPRSDFARRARGFGELKESILCAHCATRVTRCLCEIMVR